MERNGEAEAAHGSGAASGGVGGPGARLLVKERSAEVVRATKCRGTPAAMTAIASETSPPINRSLGSPSTPVPSPHPTAATPVGTDKFDTFSNFAVNSFQSSQILS